MTWSLFASTIQTALGEISELRAVCSLHFGNNVGCDGSVHPGLEQNVRFLAFVFGNHYQYWSDLPLDRYAFNGIELGFCSS